MATWINGKLEVVGSYAFAYLTAPADTTVTTSGTYYPISGTFANLPTNNFTGVSDPAIQYDAMETLYFEIDWHATVSTVNNGRTIMCGIKVNSDLETSSVMQGYLKTGGEPQNISGTCIVELDVNDKVQLVVTSSSDGDVITFHNYTTSIRKFY